MTQAVTSAKVVIIDRGFMVCHLETTGLHRFKVLFFLCNMDNHATVEKGGTVLGHLCACTHVPGCHIYLDKHYQAVAWCMAALGLVTTVHIFIIMLEQKQQDVGFSDETRKSE